MQHPAIERLMALAPRIRIEREFRLRSTGAHVTGFTTTPPEKAFAADMSKSPPTWTSNDETFWEPVKQVLLRQGSTEQELSQYLFPEGWGASRPEYLDPPPQRLNPAPRIWATVAVLLACAGWALAGYQYGRLTAKAPEPDVAKAAEAPVAKAPQPPVAKAPEPPAPKAPEPPAAAAPKPEVAATIPPSASEGATAPEPPRAPRAKAEASRQPSQGCYKQGEIITVRGQASRRTIARGDTSSEAWVVSTMSPLCVYDAVSEPRLISELQVVGQPPPAGVALELTGELFTRENPRFAMNDRIRVKQGRRLQ